MSVGTARCPGLPPRSEEVGPRGLLQRLARIGRTAGGRCPRPPARPGGRFSGVAPGAKLLDAKVCEFRTGFCEESAILAAMQWAAEEMRNVGLVFSAARP